MCTAEGSQNWEYDENGAIHHFPVDYYYEKAHTACFLGEQVTKYHCNLTTYWNTLLVHGFTIHEIVAPCPSQEPIDTIPSMIDEMCRLHKKPPRRRSPSSGQFFV